jgi:hypothetical protein
MRHRVMMGFAIALSLAASAAFAAPADEFNAAYAKAETAQKQAVQMKAAWTTTVVTLANAKKAAEAGKFDDATALAQHAEALANASIAQAKEQETLWRDAVIK